MMKRRRRAALAAILATTLIAGSALAATKTYNITANSNSDQCTANMGSFSPPNVTANAGDTVVMHFSVPASDPYSGGIEIRGLGSSFTIPRGGSNSTTVTANQTMTFSSYWPSTSCHKADGQIIVSGAAPAAPTAPAPSQPGKGSGTPPPAAATPTPTGSGSASSSNLPATGSTDVFAASLGLTILVVTYYLYREEKRNLNKKLRDSK
jgi:hypothetical protein